jgi:recombination protein RecT
MSNIEKTQSNIVESVTKRVEQLRELGQINLPKDYSAPNAIRAAWLVLQDKPDLITKSTPISQMNAMFKMVISGLSVAKKQGDFILYGNKLTFSPEYHGNKALVKRLCGVIDVTHNTIYKDDVFEYTIDKHGRKQIIKHEQKIENIDPNKIVGAYAIVTFIDGESTQAEVMNMQQIKQSWMQGATKGQSPAHRNFPDRMAEKTVANRLMTGLINASDDAAIIDFNDENVERKQVSEKNDEPKKEKTISFDEPENVEYEDNEPQVEEEKKPEPTPTPEPEKKKEQPKKDIAKQGKDLFDSEEPF